MRSDITRIIASTLEAARESGEIAAEVLEVIVEKPKRAEFGDFSTNVAMLLAPKEGKKPRELAGLIAERIVALEGIERTEVAGPGFINLFMTDSYWRGLLKTVLEKGADFGKSSAGKGKRVQVEFVSANPTGPLHIGHGRGAAVGDALSRVLAAAGYDVTREFYINDAGRQVYNLGESVKLRCKELDGEEVELGEDHYKGDYVIDIAKKYNKMVREKSLGKAASIPTEQDFASKAMLEQIENDLKDFGVDFDVWFPESDLDDGRVMGSIAELEGRGDIFVKDGAKWLKTEKYGDDKDRVLIKKDGERTYFASDIAYHRDKFERGFDSFVNIWGADHHGYEARVRAALKAFGYDDKRLKIIFIQMVSLLREGEPVSMGKRAGEFVTLRDVIDEVGKDACRFFFLMRKADAHLDFDLELAKREAPENPVYYVQYCHARIASIISHAAEQGVELPAKIEQGLLERLGEKEEFDLIKKLSEFTETVERSAEEMAPHKVTFYLQELAGIFHSFYNRHRVVTDDAELSKARLLLCRGVKTVVSSGLSLMGVSAPEKM